MRDIRFRAFVDLGPLKFMLQDVSFHSASEMVGTPVEQVKEILETTDWRMADDCFVNQVTKEEIQYDHAENKVKVYDTGDDYLFFDGALMMQFTGLLDKNGTGIHESDIVKEKDGTQSTIVFETINEKGDLDIDRVIIGWLRKWNDGGLSPIGFYSIPEFEIIGNIHENRELLNS